MIRARLLLVALLLLVGCPGPGGKVDPYATARTVINSMQFSVSFADAIFNQWAIKQTDPAKVKAASEKYAYIRLLVLDGLQAALKGVDIAEQAKKDPDMTKLMDQAELAWKDVRVFLADLLKTPAPPPPTTQPTDPALRAKLKLEKVFGVKDLPETLLPKK